jgi:hypothetical protein
MESEGGDISVYIATYSQQKSCTDVSNSLYDDA